MSGAFCSHTFRTHINFSNSPHANCPYHTTSQPPRVALHSCPATQPSSHPATQATLDIRHILAKYVYSSGVCLSCCTYRCFATSRRCSLACCTKVDGVHTLSTIRCSTLHSSSNRMDFANRRRFCSAGSKGWLVVCSGGAWHEECRPTSLLQLKQRDNKG